MSLNIDKTWSSKEDDTKNLACTVQINAIPPSSLDQFGTLQSAPDNPDQDIAGSFQLPCLFAEMKDQNAVSF